MVIRPATAADAPAVAAVYADSVLHGLGTFEEVAPSPQEMAARMAAVDGAGLPWFIAHDPGGRTLGFAYAAPFRPRAAYRHTAEDSIYLDPDARGLGVGRALLAAIVARCEALGVRQLMAVIGDSGNAASIGLHAALGFERTGLLPAVGWKHGRWVDVVTMRLALNGGDATPPPT